MLMEKKVIDDTIEVGVLDIPMCLRSSNAADLRFQVNL